MNDFLTSRMPMTAINGNVATDLIANLGPNGDQFTLNLPKGFVARLWDFAVYRQVSLDQRYGINLVRSPSIQGPTQARIWTNDDEVLTDGSVIAALSAHNINGTGDMVATFPHTSFLWDMDYRVVLNPRVTGFVQVIGQMGFRLRYKLMRATTAQIASIMSWQNEGVTRA